MLKRIYMLMDQNNGGQGSGGGGAAGAGGAAGGAPAAGSQGAPGGAGGAGAGAPDPAAGAFALPDAYKDRAYLKDVKSYDDVFKMLDGAQTLIGKRPAGVPDDKAPQEEWDKFYAAAGRPEKADAYEFDDSVLGEGNKRDEALAGQVKGIFHKAGLSGKQAKIVQTEYDKLVMGQLQQQQQAAQEADAKFDTDAAALFGPRKDEALGVAKKLLTEHLPESMKAHIGGLGNKELLMMASVLDKVHSTYMKEDAPNKGGQAPGKSMAEVEAEAMALQASEAYRSNLHPEHEAVRAKVRQLYVEKDRLRSLGTKQ